MRILVSTKTCEPLGRSGSGLIAIAGLVEKLLDLRVFPYRQRSKGRIDHAPGCGAAACNETRGLLGRSSFCHSPALRARWSVAYRQFHRFHALDLGPVNSMDMAERGQAYLARANRVI